MEFSNIGKHCSLPSCKKHDFLPFKCDYCHETYCTDHRLREQHNCVYNDDITKQNTQPLCPLCNKHIYVPAGVSPDLRVNQHIQSNCQKHLLDDIEQLVKQKQSTKLRCDMTGCKNKNHFETIQCKYCHRQYCLTHRSVDGHNCEGFKNHTNTSPYSKHANGTGILSKGQALLSRLKSKSSSSTSTSPRNNSTSSNDTTSNGMTGIYSSSSGSKKSSPAGNKSLSLQQVRQRLRAAGDDRIAENDRFYFDIVLPATNIDGQSVSRSGDKNAIMAFFSKNNTIGKMLDEISEKYHLENRNHENKQGIRKLVAYSDRTKNVLPMDIPLILLTPQVSSGDSITLKYIHPS